MTRVPSALSRGLDAVLAARAARGAVRAPRPRVTRATVVFVDLMGFAKLCRGAPPGQVARLLDRFYRMVHRNAVAEGGWIDKFIGDAAMILFGLPEPIECPERAAFRAAVRLQKEVARWTKGWGPRPRLRVGIAAGPVWFGPLGPPECRTLTAIGETVNRAARLLPPGKEGIRVGPEIDSVLQGDMPC